MENKTNISKDKDVAWRLANQVMNDDFSDTSVVKLPTTLLIAPH